MVKTLISASVVALLLVGCGSNPKTLGDLAEQRSDAYDQVAEDYKDGNKLIAKGEKQIKKGRKQVKKGHDLIDEGQGKVNKGSKLKLKAKSRYDAQRALDGQ